MKVERNALATEYETEFIDKQFDNLFLIFSDETYNELTADNKPREGVISPAVIAKIKQNKEYLINNSYQYLDDDIIHHFIDEKVPGFFFALISEGRTNPSIFSIKPRLMEQVVFAKGDWAAASIGRFYRPLTMEQTVNSPAPNDKNIDSIVAPFFRLLNRNISIKYLTEICINFNCSDTLQLISNFKNRSWFNFRLDKRILVNSVIFKEKEQYFYKSKETNVFLIKLDEQIKENDTFQIIVNYQNNNSNYISNEFIATSPNTIRYNYRAYIKFTSRFEIISDADSIKNFVNDYEKIAELIGKNKYLDFSIGKHKITLDTIDNNTRCKIYHYNDYTPKELLLNYQSIGNFFISLFGNLDTNQIVFSPYFGSYKRGIIRYLETENVKYSDTWHYSFARSLSNQWWNGSLKPLTYRDDWLTEALTSYSFILYLSLYAKDTKSLDNTFIEYRDRLLHFLKSKEKFVGVLPFIYRDFNQADVIMGYKSFKTRNDYGANFLMSGKGLFIIHSLRNMLIDLDANNEELFLDILRDLFKTYKSKFVSTENFKHIIEKHTNLDMTWFFDQWVYDNQIPEYTFGYKIEKVPEGKFKVKCRAKQENVKEDFVMPVLIRVNFDDNKFYTARVVINNKITEFELPLLPLEPKDIKFNFNYSVLCEETTDDYEDIK